MTDLDFVQKCVTGDKLAWNQFVERYSRLIYKYIHSVLNTTGTISIFNQEHINDLFQEIFLSLMEDNFRKLKSYKGKNGCTLASWLRQVAVNRTIDYIRKLRPLVSIDAEIDDPGYSLKETLTDDAINPVEALVSQEQIKQLEECIENLGTEDKYFLELHINQGLALEKIKGILKLKRSAVDMRKSRIIIRLKECFQSKGFELDL